MITDPSSLQDAIMPASVRFHATEFTTSACPCCNQAGLTRVCRGIQDVEVNAYTQFRLARVCRGIQDVGVNAYSPFHLESS